MPVLKESHAFLSSCVSPASRLCGWHPFTVYKHPEDLMTVRFVFRPVGPFTKKLGGRLLAPQRPVTMLDGFYPGGDCCGEALQHDCIIIAAGGVTITPFLFMLLSVLSWLSSSSSTRTTKSITLHWVCHEKELIQFVQQMYLESILLASQHT
jgi:predicted ferric reductase